MSLLAAILHTCAQSSKQVTLRENTHGDTDDLLRVPSSWGMADRHAKRLSTGLWTQSVIKTQVYLPREPDLRALITSWLFFKDRRS